MSSIKKPTSSFVQLAMLLVGSTLFFAEGAHAMEDGSQRNYSQSNSFNPSKAEQEDLKRYDKSGWPATLQERRNYEMRVSQNFQSNQETPDPRFEQKSDFLPQNFGPSFTPQESCEDFRPSFKNIKADKQFRSEVEENLKMANIIFQQKNEKISLLERAIDKLKLSIIEKDEEISCAYRDIGRLKTENQALQSEIDTFRENDNTGLKEELDILKKNISENKLQDNSDDEQKKSQY